MAFEGKIHFTLSTLAGVGFLYGDARLENILHESSVLAQGSVRQILSGKDICKLVDQLICQTCFMNYKVVWMKPMLTIIHLIKS